MFEAVELPGGVAHLDPGLADVHADHLPQAPAGHPQVRVGRGVGREGEGGSWIRG